MTAILPISLPPLVLPPPLLHKPSVQLIWSVDQDSKYSKTEASKFRRLEECGGGGGGTENIHYWPKGKVEFDCTRDGHPNYSLICLHVVTLPHVVSSQKHVQYPNIHPTEIAQLKLHSKTTK